MSAPNSLFKRKQIARRRVAGPLRNPHRDFAHLPPLPPKVLRTYGHQRKHPPRAPLTTILPATKPPVVSDLELPVDHANVAGTARKPHGLQLHIDEPFVLQLPELNEEEPESGCEPAPAASKESCVVDDELPLCVVDDKLPLCVVDDELPLLPYSSVRYGLAKSPGKRASSSKTHTHHVLVSTIVDELCTFRNPRQQSGKSVCQKEVSS